MHFNISRLNCTTYNMQPSYGRKKFVSCSYFAISVYKKGYLRNVFSHQKIQRGMYMAILTNTISKF